MNKQMRLVVSALFIVIILLAVAITRFYSDTGSSTTGGNTQTDISRRLSSDSSGNRIFKDSNNLYGVIDSSERITVAPEWLELSFTGADTCIASKRIGGKLLTGCIDYEGNVVIPFIYRNITRYSYGDFCFFKADSDKDTSCVIYDKNFIPFSARSWDSCVLSENELTLTSGSGLYTYSVSEAGFMLKYAEIYGETLGCEYKFVINSRILLSKLTPAMIEKISTISGKYIEFAYTGSGEHLAGIRTDNSSEFTPLFPEDKKILSKKLEKINNIFLYSVKSEDDVPHYQISITADTEISYSDEDDKVDILRDKYKAVIEFRGSSENNLAAISGKFVLSEPDYPQSESENGDNTESENHQH